MDEALLKSGQYPNIAIEAGTDPAEVMREHGRTGTEHMDNGVSVHMCPNDSREKLETDILFEYLEFPGDQNRIFAYLDRQAAITRAECKNTLVHFAERLQLVQNGYDAAVGDMQPKVDELTAERDRLQAKVDELNANWRKANDGWAEANAEAERLQHANNTLRASVAGLKMTVEKRTPDPVEIQAQLARFASEWERADTRIQEQRLIACYAWKLANG